MTNAFLRVGNERLPSSRGSFSSQTRDRRARPRRTSSAAAGARARPVARASRANSRASNRSPRRRWRGGATASRASRRRSRARLREGGVIFPGPRAFNAAAARAAASGSRKRGTTVAALEASPAVKSEALPAVPQVTKGLEAFRSRRAAATFAETLSPEPLVSSSDVFASRGVSTRPAVSAGGDASRRTTKPSFARVSAKSRRVRPSASRNHSTVSSPYSSRAKRWDTRRCPRVAGNDTSTQALRLPTSTRRHGSRASGTSSSAPACTTNDPTRTAWRSNDSGADLGAISAVRSGGRRAFSERSRAATVVARSWSLEDLLGFVSRAINRGHVDRHLRRARRSGRVSASIRP